MKGVFKSTHIFIAAGLLCLAAPAFAHWKVSYECDGTSDSSSTFLYYQPSAPENVSWDHYPYNVTSDGVKVYAGATSDLTQDAKISGKVRAVLTWIPDSPNQPVPASVSVKEDLYGEADVNKVGYSETEEPDGSDGGDYGDPNGSSTVTVDLADTVPDPNNPTAHSAEGHPLKSYPTNGQTVVPLPWRHLSASASGTPFTSLYSRWPFGAAGAAVLYKAQEDTRSVTLSRGGRDERSELKDGEWHTSGDSIFSAKNPTSRIPGKDKEIPLSINVKYSDGWNTQNVTPTWTTGGFDPTPTTSKEGASGITEFGAATVYVDPDAGDYVYVAPKSGTTSSTTSYTAKDWDGATSTAHYTLTLHDPVEPISPDNEGEPTSLSVFTVQVPMERATLKNWWSDVSGADGSRPKVHFGYSLVYGLKFSATSEASAFKKLLGFSAEASAEAKSEFSVAQDLEVPIIPAGAVRYLVAKHEFSRKHRRFWMYDQFGKIKRLLTKDAQGNTLNPPQEVWQEAFEDTVGNTSYDWSPEIRGTDFDPNNEPHGEVPPYEYNYPSGGSS